MDSRQSPALFLRPQFGGHIYTNFPVFEDFEDLLRLHLTQCVK